MNVTYQQIHDDDGHHDEENVEQHVAYSLRINAIKISGVILFVAEEYRSVIQFTDHHDGRFDDGIVPRGKYIL